LKICTVSRNLNRNAAGRDSGTPFYIHLASCNLEAALKLGFALLR
jgi:hypothetical protein